MSDQQWPVKFGMTVNKSFFKGEAWGELRVFCHDERGYLKHRLNERLKGHNPGPWEKDPMKR